MTAQTQHDHISRVDYFISDVAQIIHEHDQQKSLLQEIANRLQLTPTDGSTISRDDFLKRVDSVMLRLKIIS